MGIPVTAVLGEYATKGNVYRKTFSRQMLLQYKLDGTISNARRKEISITVTRQPIYTAVSRRKDAVFNCLNNVARQTIGQLNQWFLKQKLHQTFYLYVECSVKNIMQPFQPVIPA